MVAHWFVSTTVSRYRFDCSLRLQGTCLTLLLLTIIPGVLADESTAADSELTAHGRYLTTIAGCNDCHTPGYAFTGGQVPESEWLTGDSLGWRGPWGTTYPSNLRLLMQSLGEDEWVTRARTVQYRPPMPWFSLRDMSDYDLRAIYRYIRNQGPAGHPAPAWVPPDQEPQGPYVQFPAPPQ